MQDQRLTKLEVKMENVEQICEKTSTNIKHLTENVNKLMMSVQLQDVRDENARQSSKRKEDILLKLLYIIAAAGVGLVFKVGWDMVSFFIMRVQ